MIAQIDISLVNVKLKLYEAQVMLLHTNEAPVMHFFPAENSCEELKLHMIIAYGLCFQKFHCVLFVDIC